MIRISVRNDFDRMARILTEFERRQLPFAAARALTATARSAKTEVEHGMPSAFDRPTPFTQRALLVVPALKQKLQAEIVVKDIQAAYLRPQEKGGTRRPKKRALVNPAGVRLNQYGNIPNKALARLKKRRDIFVGQVKGIGGVWQRPKAVKGAEGKLKLLMRFDGPNQVKPHPFFFAPIRRTVPREFARRLPAALAEALRSARR